MHTASALCPRRWGPTRSLSSTVASMCQAAPFSSPWGRWVKVVPTRCGLEARGWSEGWLACQPSSASGPEKQVPGPIDRRGGSQQGGNCI